MVKAPGAGFNNMLASCRTWWYNTSMKKAFPILMVALILCSCSGKQEAQEGSVGVQSNQKALLEVVNKYDLEKIRTLLAAGVDIDAKDENGRTVLHLAILRGGMDGVQLHEGFLKTVELLIAKGASVKSKDVLKNTLLHEYRLPSIADILDLGDTTKVPKLLLANGSDINARNWKGQTPLHLVIQRGDARQLISLYLAHGADINALDNEGYSPLDYALYWGRSDMAIMLDLRGAEFGDSDRVGMLRASQTGDLQWAKRLVVQGVSVNGKDLFSNTPLHEASKNGHKEIVEFLLVSGAELHTSNIHGNTPLHLAKSREVAEILIANGADVNAGGATGKTPLHHVAFFGNREVAQVLASNGGAVNAKEWNGRTPLHIAAREGYSGICNILLNAGADLNTVDDEGKTPLDYAKTEEMKKLLRSQGAKTIEEIREENK